MKSRHVHRAVKSQRLERSAGDAPTLGRVARMPGVGMPKELRKRRRRGQPGPLDRTGKERRMVLLAWSAVLVVLVLGVMGFLIFSWMRGHMNRPSAKTGTGEISELEKRVVSAFVSPSEDDAIGLVKNALAVRDPEEVPRYFRPGKHTPRQILDYLANGARVDGPVTGYEWLSSMDANNMLIDGVLVSTLRDGMPRNRIALLTPDSSGEWKIDFEAFARVVDPPWPQILDANNPGGIVRVVAARDSYYNGVFKDESVWRSYGLASPDMDEVLVGYCRRDTPQARALDRIISESSGDVEGARQRIQRVTLEIRRLEGAEVRQFEITRVLAEDWIISDRAFDGLPLPSAPQPP